ncbi:hypothetical protein [Myxococcus qinghaiensis]|uniref:hypothetical protein n=1 Tax=Myxococcus qinghaiensis TaxID=2906758 RepID=UPI0020A741DA|nr:hypothetical protein [Myxococcus qinghaiensis]MCP3162430.1 hypothetical protein [Myxococcus qinghaiensis]
MKSLLALVAAALFSVIVNPLSVGLGRLFLGVGPQNMSAMPMLIPYVAVPLVGFIALGVAVAHGVPRTPPVRWGLVTGAVSAPVLTLAGQVYAWAQVHTDAQAPIALLFVPLYASMASGILAVVAILVRWLIGRWRGPLHRTRVV